LRVAVISTTSTQLPPESIARAGSSGESDRTTMGRVHERVIGAISGGIDGPRTRQGGGEFWRDSHTPADAASTSLSAPETTP